MSNLHNFLEVFIEMTSYSHHVMQTKNKNRQTMDTIHASVREVSLIDH